MEETKEIIEEETETMEETEEKIEEERKTMEETKEKIEEDRETTEETKEKIEGERETTEENKEKIEEEREPTEETKEEIEKERETMEETKEKMEETNNKVGMEEIIQAADATYERLTEKAKKEIEKMFKAMDKDEDGKISIDEFKTYFEGKGDSAKVKSNLFNLIDRNCDGNLGFDEVLTLFYISESCRPVCDVCSKFIEALFFTCIYCHYSEPEKDGYNVCIACYKNGVLKHEHTEFIDNYTLFADMKMKNKARLGGVLQTNSSSSSRGNGQQTYRKRDVFKRGFNGFSQWITSAASIAGASATLASNSEE